MWTIRRIIQTDTKRLWCTSSTSVWPNTLCTSTLAKRSAQLEGIKKLREETGAPVTEVKAALVSAGWDIEKAHVELRKRGVAAAEKKKAKRTAAQGLIALAVSACKTQAALVEVNCETDFVSRNEVFQKLAKDAAQAVLLQGSSGPIEGDKILSLPTIDGQGKTIGEQLTDVNLAVREKVEVRRGEALKCSNGIIATYLHMSPTPNVGSIGSMVAVSVDQKIDSGNQNKITELGKKLAMHVVAAKPLFLSIDSVPEDIIEAEKDVLRSQPGVSSKPPNIIEKMITGRLEKYMKQIVLLKQNFIMDDSQSITDVLKQESKDLDTAVNIPQFLRYQVGEGIEKKEVDFAQEVAEAVKQT